MSYDKHIIRSLLDTDFYKFTMGNLIYCQFPDMHVKYKFKLRGPEGVEFTVGEKMRIYEELSHWCTLRFSEGEIAFLDSLGYFDKSYIEFLSKYQPNINHLEFDPEKEFDIVVSGPCCQTIFWEIACLAIVSEVHSERFDLDQKKATGILEENVARANQHGLVWADFGTRRRFSGSWQLQCDRYAKENCPTFVGTSNVLNAKHLNIKPIGTMAHEYLSIGQAIVHLMDAQKEMLQRWSDQYRGNLGIALTDIVGIDYFIKDFDYYFAKLYDGVSHDSGCPYMWADKIIDHYKRLNIDPMTKTLVFSDGLTFQKACELHVNYKGKAKVSAGIGTKFTNDVGHPALQIVMKAVEVNGRPVAKLSDSPGKCMCDDDDYIRYLETVFRKGVA